jgi:hypothetical protein
MFIEDGRPGGRVVESPGAVAVQRDDERRGRREARLKPSLEAAASGVLSLCWAFLSAVSIDYLHESRRFFHLFNK